MLGNIATTEIKITMKERILVTQVLKEILKSATDSGSKTPTQVELDLTLGDWMDLRAALKKIAIIDLALPNEHLSS